jgi:hypothetical protein
MKATLKTASVGRWKRDNLKNIILGKVRLHQMVEGSRTDLWVGTALLKKLKAQG